MYDLGPLNPTNESLNPIQGLEVGPNESVKRIQERVMGNNHVVVDRGLEEIINIIYQSNKAVLKSSKEKRNEPKLPKLDTCTYCKCMQ